MTDLIYFDNNASTKPLAEVVESMLSVLGEQYANPSSLHQFGQAVRHRVEVAREQVASLIGAESREIIFTGGGTEAINLAIRGVLHGHPDRRHIVTTAVEHTAVLKVVEQLEHEGYRVDYVGVDADGRVDADQWSELITGDTALVSIQHANNETGVVNDVVRLGGVACERGVPVHVDAVQTVGKLPINASDWPAQLVSLSAHKFHGPKGTGALYVQRRTRIEPLILGGGQERRLRGGTEHVAGIVGMGVAASLVRETLRDTADRVGRMRNALEAGLLAAVPYAVVNGSGADRVYNTSNISFAGLEAEAILILLSEAGICASSGAACSSGSLQPSHVLQAMGIDEAVAHGAIRLSLSRFNTNSEVDRVVQTIPDLLSRLTAVTGSRR